MARRRKKYIEIEEVPGKPLRYWPHVLGGGMVAEGAVVDPQAFVHESAYVDPGARVLRGARVSSGSWVAEDAFVDEDAVVGTNSCVGRGSRLGRGARLGMRAILGDRVRVADFHTVDADERVPAGVVLGEQPDTPVERVTVPAPESGNGVHRVGAPAKKLDRSAA